MEEVMDDTIEYTFTAVEIDLNYEFDAARCFDFSREESLAEAHEAELWFDSAGSYPPSPFVTKLIMGENLLLENVNTSPKPKAVKNMTMADDESDVDVELEIESSAMEVNTRECGEMVGSSTSLQHGNQNQLPQIPTGLKFYNPMMKETSKVKAKSTLEPSMPRISTLRKPTASQLAKQNMPCQVSYSRFQKDSMENNDRSSNNVCGIENQAAKRQKLEGGLLHKVAYTKQKTNLVHKAPKKDVTIGEDLIHQKLRLTIPREPALATALRAQKLRPKTRREPELVASTNYQFKARPLNKKILEGPSFLLPKRTTPRLPEFQEFHLKTSERAMQHTSAFPWSSSACSSHKPLLKPAENSFSECRITEIRRANCADALKHQGCEKESSFKARPLNKKIFSSKGEIGVYRNIKKETTVPMEFNFHTEKRFQRDPPIELFNKLSLTSQTQLNAGTQLKSPWNCAPTKGCSKENRFSSFQQEYEMKHFLREKQPSSGLNHYENHGVESLKPYRARTGL